MPSELDAMRDELARLRGLEAGWGYHPFPPGDLTALVAAIPKGANLSIERTAEGIWTLRSGWPIPYEGAPAASMEEALLPWLVAVMRAERGATGKGAG